MRSGRSSLKVQDSDGDNLWVGRSSARRVLLFVVLSSSLAPESHATLSGCSLQLPSSPVAARNAGGWPAFLVAPHLPLWSGALPQRSAAGSPLPVCRRSPWAPHAAPPRLLPVSLVSRGTTPDPRNVPWTLQASAGPVLSPHFFSLH
jgi:hypothetical protein